MEFTSLVVFYLRPQDTTTMKIFGINQRKRRNFTSSLFSASRFVSFPFNIFSRLWRASEISDINEISDTQNTHAVNKEENDVGTYAVRRPPSVTFDGK